MLKLHLINSLSTCYTAICATNTVKIKPMELMLKYIAPTASTVEGETNTSSDLLIPASSVQWRNFLQSPQLCRQKLVM